jgi:hypothetical protein
VLALDDVHFGADGLVEAMPMGMGVQLPSEPFTLQA